jgi:hypothetical protein
LYILDIFSYSIITKWYTHTYISWTSYFFANNLRENEVTSLGPFSYTLCSKSFNIMSIFLNWTWFAPPNYTLKVWVGLDFFFQIFKWFQSSGNNLISRKRKHDFHLQRHCPMWIYLASMIWRGCVWGRKINPPFPIVLTSLFICNLYMNPITFNYPFFLLLPPFWFQKTFLHICLFYFSPIIHLGVFFSFGCFLLDFFVFVF